MIDKNVRLNLLVFLRENLGKLMTFSDYMGRSFTGIIRTPDAEFIEQTRGLSTVRLEFETES
ncbi:MAG TPA: hypothetical protein VM260_18095 [Pirellula sp.]|nr:hypothetical protein [Pirellula sp.]